MRFSISIIKNRLVQFVSKYKNFLKIYCVGYAEDVTLVEYSTLSQGSGHSSSQSELENLPRCTVKILCWPYAHAVTLFTFDSTLGSEQLQLGMAYLY